MLGKAQEGVRGGPFAALLILLGLLVGTGPVGGQSVRDPIARLAPLRTSAGAATARSGERIIVADDDADSDAAAFLPPPPPRIVVELLATRPLPGFAAAAASSLSPIAAASYHARAPPAA